MDEKVLRFRVGIFVVIAMLILAILIFLNSEGWSRQYTLYLKPQSAPGVTVGTPVRKNGILIGRVSSVRTEDDHVVLGLDINEEEKIYSNEIISIGTESFLGDAGVEVLPMPAATRGDLVSQNDMLSRVTVKRNPMEIVDVALELEDDIAKTLEAVRTAGLAVNDAGAGIRELTGNVNRVLTDDNSNFKNMVTEITRASRKAEAALDNFNRIFENVNQVVADPVLKDNIRDFIDTLPAIFREVQLTVTDTRKTINSFREISSKAGDNLDSLSTFTDSLKTNGPEILEQVNGALANVDGLVEKIGSFADTLGEIQETFQNQDGTIGKLFNESDLYDSVLETVANVQELSTKLEPMVNDLRSFSDAIARDPGVLGVRGALDRRPSKTGYKGTPGGLNLLQR